MPKVSICIPAYNQTKYLKKTIDSILSQTYKDYEIVITDDSPGPIVQEFIAQYNLPGIIKYYKNASSLGSPENWNESLRKSTGDYIKMLHHDDWLYYDDSLAKYVALLDDNPGVDFAFSATYVKSECGENRDHLISKAQFEELLVNPLCLYTNNIVGAPSTTIVRRSAMLMFDPELKWQVDKENYIRQLTVKNKIGYSNELLVITFLAEGRVTDECVDNKEIEIFEYFYVLNKIMDRKQDYARRAIRECVLKAIIVCRQYKIKKVKEIRNCGYFGPVPFAIRAYLTFTKMSPLAVRLYLKIFRAILSL